MKPDPTRVASMFLEAGKYHTLGKNFLTDVREGRQPDGREVIQALDAIADYVRKTDWDEELAHLNDGQRAAMVEHYGLAATEMLSAANVLRRSLRNTRKKVKRRDTDPV